MSMPALAPVPPQAPAPQVPPPQAAPEAPKVVRPSRPLIGWMLPDQAQGIVQKVVADPVLAAEAVQRAHQAVAARAAGVDQGALITSVPDELAEHARALEASPAARPMFDEGWTVALVDLTRVCAFQPGIFTDQALARVQAVDKNDLASIAALTLPLAQIDQAQIQYDAIHKSWIVSSPNSNLRIVTQVGPLPVSPGGSALGFALGAGPSFMQVARYNGRHFLRDGYHRAFGMLSRGFTIVPAFIRDITRFEELMPDPRVMLPQDSYLGERPPLLPDYLDDAVSVSVQLPAPHPLIVIQALELQPIG